MKTNMQTIWTAASVLALAGLLSTSAWATDANGRPLTEPVPGGDGQREMALRFGINLVMYALTGNYKTDLVHAPALIQRLGNGK